MMMILSKSILCICACFLNSSYEKKKEALQGKETQENPAIFFFLYIVANKNKPLEEFYSKNLQASKESL
jgi:hypothetical protein